jgi:hypothetical protein
LKVIYTEEAVADIVEKIAALIGFDWYRTQHGDNRERSSSCDRHFEDARLVC